MTSPHGTWQRYRRECRCRRCRAAWAAYIRRNRTAHGVRPGVARIAKEIAHVEAQLSSGDGVSVGVSLTPLGGQLLLAAQRRLGVRRHEVVEELLRRCGPALIEGAPA